MVEQRVKEVTAEMVGTNMNKCGSASVIYEAAVNETNNRAVLNKHQVIVSSPVKGQQAPTEQQLVKSPSDMTLYEPPKMQGRSVYRHA